MKKIILTSLLAAAVVFSCSQGGTDKSSGDNAGAADEQGQAADSGAQKIFEKAREAFKKDGMQDYTLPEYGGKKEPPAEELLTTLYEMHGGQAVDYGESEYKGVTCKAGPVAFSLLALLYEKRIDPEKAMYYYTEMYEKYPDTFFIFPRRDGSPGGYSISGAYALLKQAELYDKGLPTGELMPEGIDYAKAMRIYYIVFNKYGSDELVGYRVPFEGIIACLEKLNKSISETEERLRALIKDLDAEWMKADTLYYLAKRYYAEGNADKALEICGEIIKDHRLAYYDGGRDGESKFYSLYASGMKMRIIKAQGKSKQEILGVKNEAKKIYEDFLYDVIYDKEYLEKPLKNAYDVHVEKVQEGYVEGYGDTRKKTGENTGY